MKLIKILSFLSLVLAINSLPAKALVIYPGDNGFESPDEGSGYVNGGPSGTPWTFTPYTNGTQDSGIAANGSGPNLVGATRGQASDSSVSTNGQAGFLQDVSSISQLVTLPAGSYEVSFGYEGRYGYITPNEIEVSLDNITLFDGTPTTLTSFTPVTTAATGYLSAGSYDLVLSGLTPDGNGDYTTFIDDVAIESVPEPADWGWMACAGMFAALALRRVHRLSC